MAPERSFTILMVSVPRCGQSLTQRRATQGAKVVYDQALLLQTLSRFAIVLPARYDLKRVLSDLTGSLTAVLGLSGSGVTIAEDNLLRFVTAVNETSQKLERTQEEHQTGPCRQAYDTGEVVRVADVRPESARWPQFSATAAALNIAGVAGIPMRLDEQIIGALNLYSAVPCEWSDEDISLAEVLANEATSYVVNASKLRQQQQLSEQLHQALESRISIEQAKGITARQRSISADQAYQHLRGHARSHNISLRAVAEAVVAVGLKV